MMPLAVGPVTKTNAISLRAIKAVFNFRILKIGFIYLRKTENLEAIFRLM
jgi:hypothetical protein